MTVPIIENIAANIVTTINGVTETNGYNQDIVVKRPSRVDYESEAAADDLTGKIYQGKRERLTGEMNSYTWRQPFTIVVYALNDDGSAVTIDTRLNTICADMEKALRVDITRGGYAYGGTDIGEPEVLVADDGSISAVILPITVDYRVLKSDPYMKG